MEPRIVATVAFVEFRRPDTQSTSLWILPVRITTASGRLLLEENAEFDLSTSKRIALGRPVRVHLSLVDIGHDPDLGPGCIIEVLPYSGTAGVGTIESVHYEETG